MTTHHHNIIITGASGFIGQALCIHLAKHRIKVKAIVRDKSKIQHILKSFPTYVDAIICPDIANPDHLEDVIQAGDTIVHLAARVHILNDQAQDPIKAFHRINVIATIALAKLAKRKNACQFVFMSSIHVNGQQTHDTPFTEDAAVNPSGDYANSKYLAEQSLTKIFQDSNTDLTILRPPLVYGKGVKGNLDKLVAILKKQIPLPFASLKSKRHFIYIKNLVSAIEAVINQPSIADHQLFLISDNESFSTGELMQVMADILKLKTKIFKCPYWLLSCLFTAIGQRSQLKKLSCELLVNNHKIKDKLNWQPPYSLKKALEETFGD